MIDITIKTLDSRNHVFSVEDELTVKQLKERIAEPVNVPVESQRLIYCGRVLVDDKKLSEYDVHGKVIHLVQRAPPSSNNDTTNSGSEGRTNTAPRRGPFRTIIAPSGRMDGASGNAMYLGAMAFPADLMDAQGISMPQPRHRLSQSRLSVARAMLRRARYTLINLESPSQSDSLQEINANNDDLQGSIAAVAQAATTAAFAAAVSGTSNVGVQHPPPIINIEATGADGEMQAEDAEPTPEGNSPDESPSGEESVPTESTDNARNGRYRFPGPVHMAELIAYIRDIERRLSPHLERFHDLVRTDPVLENPAEAQRLFDHVSKMMHFLAHAYHAISDIMCDFSQPPPRRLRCRPVLIQHSAVLQTGIPIQAQLNVGGNLSQGSQSTSSAATTETGSNNEPTVGTEAPQEETRPPTSQPETTPNQSGSRGGNLGQGNFEFYMDVGQGAITIDSMEATLVTNTSQGSSETSGTITAGPFPWGSPPPPEFLQNLMQALAGHMMGGSGSTGGSSSSSTSQPSASTDSNVTNSQARGNTTTQPTTSTQTRSTTRPHVHITPGFQGMGVPGFFDPFLPCNSHHIHGTRRRAEGQETSANSNTTSSTSQSTGTSTESPPRAASEAPSVVNLFSNLLSGMRASGGGQGQGPNVIRILPRDITVFLQGPPMQNLTLPIQTTVAEMLQTLPDHSYTEGASIFTDFIMTLARNMRVIDVLNMGTANSSVLAGLRPVLRDFIRNQLLGGREGNQAVSDAVTRINAELRPLIESICAQEDIPFRSDVDIIATVNQLNHTTIPILIRDVLEEDDNEFLRNIPNHFNDYARHLASILLYCCQNGQQGLEAIFTTLARRIIVGVPAALQNWSVVHIVNQLRAMTSGLETSSQAIQPFLVYRMPEAPPEEASSDQPQAMETEVASEAPPVLAPPSPLLAPLPPLLAPPPPPPLLSSPLPVPPILVPSAIPSVTMQQSLSDQIPDQLPDVILGAEQWHNTVPPDWVPIISRDRERQRRQAVQGPLSDAYLAGMPSKRRKVVASSKPHGNLARVISESMNTALGAAGVARVEPNLAETAGGDTSLRAAYKEQVRTTLTPTLRHHPDFSPEKYPAAAKLFVPK
ncbi:large proline-rich protein BAG6 isoform X4 [Halyomorpha halys]|uniref:large proline-rich protein BAG6 isoform X4 n=1 Tax=Halyomorpha halys TaxID=286706 RepID=UPI0034D23FC6